jgi:EpsI family protein
MAGGMIARRDLIIGGACAVAAAGGIYLRPHREAPLVRDVKLPTVVPKTFGGWTSDDIGDPLATNTEGAYSAHIYNELLVRSYTNTALGAQITALIAYGQRQNDDQQLHRPEVCYPAFGFTLARNEPTQIPIANGVAVPARRLAAVSDDHKESVMYWSRIGEFLPQDGGQQRSARFQIAMKGIIADGLLCRFSTGGERPDADWTTIGRFVAELVTATRPDMRKVLIGSERAAAIGALPSTSVA